MSDALSAIPAAVHRNLSDKLYEKRKNAAIEVCQSNLHLRVFITMTMMITITKNIKTEIMTKNRGGKKIKIQTETTRKSIVKVKDTGMARNV